MKRRNFIKTISAASIAASVSTTSTSDIVKIKSPIETLIKPGRLKKGDRIALVTPGSYITEEEKQYAQELLERAQAAQRQIADLDQAAVDRAIQAVGWATSNEKTFTRLARMLQATSCSDTHSRGRR